MFFPMQYKRIVWGLVIALIDIRLGPIDILPDFIGYILITMGLGELAEQHYFYGKGKIFSQWLIFLSLPDLYKFSNDLIQLHRGYMTAVLTLFTLTIMVIKLFMAYYICKAIMELSSDRNMSGLFDKANFIWRTYLYVNTAISALTLFGTIADLKYPSLLFIPVLIALIAEMLFISLLYSAGKELA